MKLSAASFFVSAISFNSVLADFHLATVMDNSVSPHKFQYFQAVASNRFNDCSVWRRENSGANGVTNWYTTGVPSFFTVRGYGKSFCGANQLNFYKGQNNDEWYGYINGGDGLVVATCYPGNHFHSGTSGQGDVSCPKVFAGDFEVYDQLVCYSYFCQ